MAAPTGIRVSAPPQRSIAAPVVPVVVICLGAIAAAGSYLTSSVAVAALVLALVVTVAVARRPSLGVLLAVLAIPLEVLNARFGGGFGLTPTEALMLLTGGVVLARCLTVDRLPAPGAPHAFLAALVVLMAVGLVYAEDSFSVAKITAMWTASLVLSVYVSGWNRGQVERLLWAVVIAAGVLGVVALVGSGPQQFTNGGAVVTGRASAAFEHPNLLAFYLVMAVPVALVLAADARGMGRVVAIVAALAALQGLGLTLTRGAILGFAVAVLVLAAWRPVRRALAAAVLVGILVIAIAPAAVNPSGRVQVLVERLASIGDTVETAHNPRFRIWRETLPMIADDPVLGVGAGNYAIAALGADLRNEDFGREWEGYDHAHNVLLTVAAELGLGGLALFVAFMFATGAGALRAIRTGRPADRPIMLAVAAGLAALLTAGATDYPIRANALLLTMMLLVGVVVAYRRTAERETAAARARIIAAIRDERARPGAVLT